jgi:hypothetical protein
MSQDIHPATEELQSDLRAVDIDLKCALAFNRALLKGLAATSAQARHALDAALDEEMRVIAFDDAVTAAAVHRIVGEARAELSGASAFRDRLARDLEQAIIDCAADLSDDEAPAPDEGYRLRSCA